MRRLFEMFVVNSNTTHFYFDPSLPLLLHVFTHSQGRNTVAALRWPRLGDLIMLPFICSYRNKNEAEPGALSILISSQRAIIKPARRAEAHPLHQSVAGA